VASASAAAGHAILLDSTPRAGEATALPSELVLRFNGRIEKRLSSVTLVGGARNAKTLLRESDAEAPPDTLRFGLPALEGGAYRAEWRVLSRLAPLRVVTRDDGSRQYAWKGKPRYYWKNDKKPDDTTGHKFRDVWFVAQP
jgi:methionine-rich copper-binding protein CopC